MTVCSKPMKRRRAKGPTGESGVTALDATMNWCRNMDDLWQS